MPEDALTGSPNPASGGNAQGGESPPGAASGESASQPASNQAGNPGESLQRVLEKTLAPVFEKVDQLGNGLQAMQRHLRKQGQGDEEPGDTRPNSSGESGGTNANGVKDPETRALIEQLTGRLEEQGKELRGYREKEEARAAKDLATQKRDAVKAAIFDDDGKARYANPDVLESLIGPALRVTAEGKIMVDAGDKLIPVADRVKEIGSRDIFQLAPAGSHMGIGTGDRGGQAQSSGNREGGELTMQKVENMSDDEILAMGRDRTGF